MFQNQWINFIFRLLLLVFAAVVFYRRFRRKSADDNELLMEIRPSYDRLLCGLALVVAFLLLRLYTVKDSTV